MNSRQITIVLGATVAAFVLAFGVGKATSGSEAASSGGGKAEAIEVASPSVGSFAGAGTVPALKAEKKKAKKKKKSAAKKPATGSTGTQTATAPSNTNTAPSNNTSPPPSNNTSGSGTKKSPTKLGSSTGTN